MPRMSARSKDTAQAHRPWPPLSSRVRADLQRDYDKKFNESRWQAYADFSKLVLDVLQASKGGRQQADKIDKKMQQFIERLWLSGSDDVIQAVLKWRRISNETDPQAPDSARVLLALGEVVVAMRHDLGDTDSKVGARDILATIVTDLDKFIAKNKRKK